MAKWHDPDLEPVHVGDALGNPVEMRIGVVTVNSRTTVGLQINRDNPRDLPDYTLDAQAISDLIRELTKQRSKLINTTGGL